ncbi:alpha/beta hydrolase [Nonlabens ponticola]|uniref:Alpha/beta hydrolase n=1 Tax=Nonlabens ponticola TaxID=2496866 RepID=A0A3S9MW62_9FLAO|nr:alpha/beta hydrolase [Nonlabens ponticola]AZQ43465.1 alpha/beta hydrolase [Nonlabens ponticola]
MKKKFVFISCAVVLMVITASVISCSTQKFDDISYLQSAEKLANEPQLNVFTEDSDPEKFMPVLIFVHGGNWNSGDKDTYNYLGRNFARNKMVTVLPTYTTSPQANYKEMTQQIAQSILWTRDNIKKYGGDPDRIFLTGHSAGGHLAALATMDRDYGIPQGLIKGIVLNDAAGLDMAGYFEKQPPTSSQDYLTTWTNDPAEWEKASPINFIDKNTPPIKMYVGTKTYKSIKESNLRFHKELVKVQPDVEIEYLDKAHVPMVSHLFWPWSSRFEEIKKFIDAN